VLGEIQTDRGNLHVGGSSCDSSNNDHPTALRCRGAGAVHHINSDIMQRSEIRGYSIIPSARAEYFRLLGNRKNSYLLK
jgi:hypothetical protein